MFVVFGFLALAATLATVLLPSDGLAEQIVVQCHPTDTHFLHDPRACYRYFTCYQGVATAMMCPPGFKFSPTLQACYPVPVEECFPCPNTGIHYLPHPESCLKYVMCYEGAAHGMACAEGLMFNPAIEMCDLMENANCMN